MNAKRRLVKPNSTHTFNSQTNSPQAPFLMKRMAPHPTKRQSKPKEIDRTNSEGLSSLLLQIEKPQWKKDMIRNRTYPGMDQGQSRNLLLRVVLGAFGLGRYRVACSTNQRGMIFLTSQDFYIRSKHLQAEYAPQGLSSTSHKSSTKHIPCYLYDP